MPKQSLVKLLCKEYCRIINNGVALLDTDDVIDASPVENFAGKLTMASRNEDELERGDVHFEEVFELLLAHKVSRSVLFFKNQTVTLVFHQIGVLPEGRCIVLHSVSGEMQSYWLLHQTVGELFESRRHYLHIDRVSSCFNALRCTLKFFGKVKLWKHLNALLLRHRIGDARAERRCKGHGDHGRFLEARLEHFKHSFLLATLISRVSQEATVLKEEFG